MKTSSQSSTLSESSPMLVGLAIDVSASMTKAIHNAAGPPLNRLEAFREAFEKLVKKGQEQTPRGPDGRGVALVKLFAYGFGFGNPLSVILGRTGQPVRDLLETTPAATSLISIADLADNWKHFEKHLSALVVEMFGSTHMSKALEIAHQRFRQEILKNQYYYRSLLFFLSDGMPNRGTSMEVRDKAEAIKADGVLIASCYITDQNITEPRRLYSAPTEGWPEGARLMFECSSEVPQDSEFSDYLLDAGWMLDPSGRLFAQVNQSEMLTEFLNVVISPMNHQAPKVKAREVFFSYAHEDEEFRVELEKHLSMLRRQGIISAWHDRKITAGSEWKNEIDKHLESADLIIFLISADFLASDYCYDIEMARSLARHKEGTALVIPVILKPVDWKGAPFGDLQALPTDARPVTKWKSRAEAFTDVAAGIRRAIEGAKNV